MKVALHLITNTSQGRFFGDLSQTEGIASSLLSLCKKKDILTEVFCWDFLTELDSLKESIINSQTAQNLPLHIAISAGDYGIEALTDVKTLDSSVVTVWSGHQIFSALEQAFQNLDVIALPSYLITSEIRKTFSTLLIPIFGIPHNLSIQKIEEEFIKAHWHKDICEKIDNGIKCIAVILGGSAPTVTGNILHFSIEDSLRLGRHLCERFDKEKGKLFFLVTHSPRALPSTIEALLAGLAKASLPYKYFPFTAGNHDFPAILGAVRASSGDAYVTGDSTMMLTQAITTLKESSTIAVNVSSMSDAHKAQVEYCYMQGYIRILDEDGEIIGEAKTPVLNKNSLAAETISAIVYKEFIANRFCPF